MKNNSTKETKPRLITVSTALLKITSYALILVGLILFYTPTSSAQVRAMNVISSANAQDISDLLNNLNANMRYSLTFGEFADTANKEQYFAALSEVLTRFDNEILPQFSARNKKIVLSLANPPGGFSSRADPRPKMRIFDEAWAQDAMIEVWDLLSKRYATNKTIVAYHIQNEPAVGNGTAPGLLNWYKLQEKLITTIRLNDKTHPISVAAEYSDPNKLNKIKLPKKPGPIWYSFNFYQPAKFLRQGVDVPAYKLCFPKGEKGIQQIEKSLQKAVKFTRGKKVFVSEFTTTRFAPKGCGIQFLDSILKTMKRYKWSWAYHAWREAAVWSLELPALEDKDGSPSERFKMLKKNFK